MIEDFVAPRTCSVVIVTYRRQMAALESVRSLGDPNSLHEVLVVDQTPAGESDPRIVSELGQLPKVQYWRLVRPDAIRARNFGIQHATGDVVLFLDDDILAFAGLVSAHLGAYGDERVGGVAGFIQGPGESIEEAAPAAMKDERDGWYHTSFNHHERLPVRHARGCNMSFRREILLRLGGFDSFFLTPFRDDSDMSFRVAALGYRMVFEPDAGLLHLEAPTGGTRADRNGKRLIRSEWETYGRVYRHFSDECYFLFKHFRGVDLWRHLFRAYRGTAGLSRWPWRLVIKHSLCAVGLLQAWLFTFFSRGPYFEEVVVRER